MWKFVDYVNFKCIFLVYECCEDPKEKMHVARVIVDLLGLRFYVLLIYKYL
jgi:hypothetical protein